MLIVDVAVTYGAHFEGNPPSSYLVFSTNGKYRYCPVFEKTRGPHKQYLYHDQYRPFSATVTKSSVPYSASYEGVSASFDWKPLDGWNTKEPFMIERRVSKMEERSSIEQEFAEYLARAIPKCHIDLGSAVVFHNVTEEKPPLSFLEEGMMVVWNDQYLPRDNPARVHCGEGPFLVVKDDNYIVSFDVIYNDDHIASIHKNANADAKPRSHRVILKCPDENFLISAHEGYLKRVMPKYRRVISAKEWFAFTRVNFTHIHK